MNEENQISYYVVIPATIRYDTRLKAAAGFPYNAVAMAVKGDTVADLTEDLAADEKDF